MNRKTSRTYGGTHKGSTPFQLISSREVKKKKDNKIKVKELAYPRLAEYAEYTNDSYWKHFFILASEGKFPKNFSIWNDKLTFRRKCNSDTVELYDDLEYGAQEIINFLRFHGKKSPTDNQSEMLDKYINYTWDYYSRKKDLKKIQLNLFVRDICAKNNCNNKYDQMRTSLDLWIQMKLIDNKDIDFYNNKIHSIDGIYFDSATRNLKLTKEKGNIRNLKKIDPVLVHPKKKYKNEFLTSLAKLFTGSTHKKSSRNIYTPSKFISADGNSYNSYSVPRKGQDNIKNLSDTSNTPEASDASESVGSSPSSLDTFLLEN